MNLKRSHVTVTAYTVSNTALSMQFDTIVWFDKLDTIETKCDCESCLRFAFFENSVLSFQLCRTNMTVNN
jgi:hypothetical protein